jgi:hypothetical protein
LCRLFALAAGRDRALEPLDEAPVHRKRPAWSCATHEGALDHCSLADLKRYAVDLA